MKIKIFKTAFLIISVILSLNLLSAAQNKTFNIERAKTLLSDYLSAIKSGDRGAIETFWSRESLEKKGFWESLHFATGTMSSLDQFMNFLDYYRPESEGLRYENGYYIIDFSWIPKEDKPGRAHKLNVHYYVTEEEGSYKFINPIDVLTKSWNKYESKNFVIHYKDNLNLNQYGKMIAELDEQYDDIAALMNITGKSKVDYYVAPTEEFCGEVLLMNPCNSHTSMSRNLIVSTKFNSRPELVEKENK